MKQSGKRSSVRNFSLKCCKSVVLNFLKNFFQKKDENVLRVLKKALPLHPLSERNGILKKSSLKDLDINKQVVQKAYLGKKTETVNNL